MTQDELEALVDELGLVSVATMMSGIFTATMAQFLLGLLRSYFLGQIQQIERHGLSSLNT